MAMIIRYKYLLFLLIIAFGIGGIFILKEYCTQTSITLMSFNVRNGKGLDNATLFERGAQTIQQYHPDIVALQELDNGTRRSHRKNILEEYRHRTRLPYSFYGKAIEHDGGAYGIGLLSQKIPQQITSTSLPGREEARALIIAEYEEFIIFATHFSLTKADQIESITRISKEAEKYHKPVILMGDLNITPGSAPYEKLCTYFIDLAHSEQKTFPADNPQEKIDYIMLFKPWKQYLKKAESSVIPDAYSSDHRPIQTKITLRR